MDLGLLRRQLGEDAAEAQRFVAERRPHPVVAGGGGVALVEDEVDDPEHRREPRGAVGAARHLEGHALGGERALGADDALRDGRLRDEECAGNLVGGQAAEQPERERDARLGGEHGMAGGEDQAQQVVAHIVGPGIDGRVEIGRARVLRRLELVAELFVLALEALVAAPGSIARCLAVAMSQAPGLRGMPDSGHCSSAATQRVLRQVFGKPDVAHDPRETGDEPRRLDSPDRVDCPVGVRSRHGYRSHHLPCMGARRRPRSSRLQPRASTRPFIPSV